MGKEIYQKRHASFSSRKVSCADLNGDIGHVKGGTLPPVVRLGDSQLTSIDSTSRQATWLQLSMVRKAVNGFMGLWGEYAENTGGQVRAQTEQFVSELSYNFISKIKCLKNVKF